MYVEQGEGLEKDGPRFLSYGVQVHKTIHGAFEHYFKGLLWIDLVANGCSVPDEQMKGMKLGHNLAKTFEHLPSCIQKKLE